MKPATSVVVSTYERPDALWAVLFGLSRQRDRDFEVVVADDGSGAETAEVVARAAERWFSDRIRHVRQDDDGFRLARARNLAVAGCRGDRLVFLDGDCIPRPGFVGSHRYCRPGRATCGRRALVCEEATARFLSDEESSPPGAWDQLAMWRRGAINRPPFMVDPPAAAFGLALRWRRFRGMNHGVHRLDYEAVDGNDQSFRGWGFEDSDLAIRLQNSGVRLVWAGLGSTVLHLWHREADRAWEGENLERLESVRASGRVRAVQGISSLGDA